MGYVIVRSASGFYHLSLDGRHLCVSLTYWGARLSLWWRKHTRDIVLQSKVVYREGGE